MAQVYTDKNSDSKLNRENSGSETSKVDEKMQYEQIDGKIQESKDSEENDPEESNVIRVSANELMEKKDDDSQDVDMQNDEPSPSENDSQHGNEHKSNEYEPSQDDSTGNMLRRSERNAKNNHGSYNTFGRRSFKYDDDFEYGTGLAPKKGSIEMDPPGSMNGNKRRRKTTGLATPIQEGLKRSVSMKTPSNQATLTTSENNGVVYNQGRWTCYEHFKFLEALKVYGKEWQKVQQHVSTRTSTQARSHAQKFFVKLDKKSLTLDEFLKDLDLNEVRKTLLASGMDNTDYDEEREVNLIASRKMRGSVMNIALPNGQEEKKKLEAVKSENSKRKRSELDSYRNVDSQKERSLNNIRKAFEQHTNDGSGGSNYRTIKRMKTSELGEKESK
jgi:SHAQKYF class myb-like DNA-binding protein